LLSALCSFVVTQHWHAWIQTKGGKTAFMGYCISCGKTYQGDSVICPDCKFPNFHKVNQVVAAVETDSGNFNKATKILKSTIETQYNDSSLYEDLSDVNILLNQPDKAIENMATAIKIDSISNMGDKQRTMRNEEKRAKSKYQKETRVEPLTLLSALCSLLIEKARSRHKLISDTQPFGTYILTIFYKICLLAYIQISFLC
jgi:predicted  nucleic acid-binding Zn-ribbon protein